MCLTLAYYTLSFQVKYLPGDIFDNLITTGISEIAATFVTGLAYTYLGVALGFTSSYVSAMVGVLGLIFMPGSHPLLLSGFLFALRVGLNTGLNLVYFVNYDVFPTLFTSSAFGICNFAARLSTIIAP